MISAKPILKTVAFQDARPSLGAVTRLLLSICVVLIIVLSVAPETLAQSVEGQNVSSTALAQSNEEAEIRRIVLSATAHLTRGGKFFQSLDKIAIDGDWAVVIVGLKDKATNAYIGAGGITVLVHRENGSWTAAMVGSDSFDKWLVAVPESLLAGSDKQFFQLQKSKGPRLVSETIAVDGLKLPWPAPLSRCISGYGYGQGTHSGSDYYALDFWLVYEDVAAVKGGTVVEIATGWGNTYPGGPVVYGNYVLMDIGGGIYALYAHLNTVYVSQGNYYPQGTIVGQSGNSGYSTGAHLHFRLRDANYNPIMPEPMSGYTGFQGFSCNSGIYYTSDNGSGGGGCPTVTDGVYLWDSTNCNGSRVGPLSPGGWDLSQAFNDRAESVAVPSGWSVRLYKDNSWSSPSVCVSSTTNDLHSYNYSDGTTAWRSVTWLYVYAQSNCPSPVPATPGNLRVSGTTQTSITLAWDDVSNENGYRIYRWNGSSFVYWSSVGANVTSYTDTGLNCASDYWYEVSAYNDAGESTHAGWVMGTTQACTYPDLIIQSITASPANPVTGQSVNFTIRVKNQGSGATALQSKAGVTPPPPPKASPTPSATPVPKNSQKPRLNASGFYVDFYIDRQPNANCSDEGTTWWWVDSLAAGETKDLTYTYAGFGSAGTHNLYGFADTNCYVAESNESNNILNTTINVGTPVPPDIRVVPTSFSVTLAAGQTTNRTLTIYNDGAGTLNFNITKVGGTALTVGPSGQARLQFPSEKVEPTLARMFAQSPGQPQQFFVYLKEQADLSPAYTVKNWNQRGVFVLNALQETAQRTQVGILGYLRNRISTNEVIEYRSHYILNAFVVKGKENVMRDLATRPEVARVERVKIYPSPKPIPAGTSTLTINAVEWNIAKIRASEAWALGYTGQNIVVANIDSGVRYTHQALVSHYRGNNGGGSFSHDYNWFDPQRAFTEPTDNNGHGTHTMGTMVGGDGTNQIGVAPGAKWIAAQGCEDSGCSESDLLSAAQWILAPTKLDGTNPDASKRPHVVSNSWGDCGTSLDTWYKASVTAWQASGIYPVFSNGNTSNCGYSAPFCNSVANPARYAEVTSVGATDSNDNIASFSLWGPTDDPTATDRIKPDISAPGVSIRSSVNSGNGAYASYSGTSMAAPHVAGTVALILSANANLIGQFTAVEGILKNTAVQRAYATNCGNEGSSNIPNDAFGYGRIDAFAAVQSALNNVDWLAVNPTSGTIGAGSSQNITLTFNATNLSAGTYNANLVIISNDPDENPTNVPVQLEADTASLSLPNTGGEQNALVQVPLNLANVNGLAAADLTVTFNSSVLTARNARTGSLTPTWTVVTNTNTAGQIRLAMASAGGTVSGSGSLALIEFEVKGSPGVTTTLHIASASLNDGAIPVQTADGSFAVNLAYRVSGTVRTWNGSAGVAGAILTLDGDRLYAAQTSASGTYTVTGVMAGNYTLTPSKSDGVNGITAYDASLVLQHSAGLTNLTGYAATAADVDKSGAITSMDAFYILQKAADLITLPFAGAGVVWDFDPRSRSYSNLNSSQTGQDFTAILLGDVSGNWTAMGQQAPQHKATNPATIRVQGGTVSANGIATTTISLDPAGAQVYSLDLVLSYDAVQATALSADLGSMFSDEWLLTSNLSQPGQIRLALAGAYPLSGAGTILRLRFQLSDPRQITLLQPTRGDVNEGMIPTQLVGGPLNRGAIYLPIISR